MHNADIAYDGDDRKHYANMRSGGWILVWYGWVTVTYDGSEPQVAMRQFTRELNNDWTIYYRPNYLWCSYSAIKIGSAPVLDPWVLSNPNWVFI